MKRATKAKVNSAIAAALISVPIIIAKVNADHNADSISRKPSEHEIDVQIRNNTATASTELLEIETVASTEISTETSTEIETSIETSTEMTTAAFRGYAFIPLDMQLQQETYQLCAEYEIAYDLILAVMKTESEFMPDVIGDNGRSIGLMQIQPEWWQGLADAAGLNINEPADNVKLGILILTDAMNANMGDLFKALKQYNSGDPNYSGTEYIETVLSNYQWILDQKAGE